jgi:hypothetical protein
VRIKGSGSETPHVTIIIVNWNAKKALEACLSSIVRTRYPNLDVMVVDNGSTDSSVTMVRDSFPTVSLIENHENLGFSKANNQGIRLALANGADYVLLLNNDSQARDEDWLVRLVELAEADRDIGIVGPRLIYPSGHLQVSAYVISPLGLMGYMSRGSEERMVEVDGMMGAALLVKRAVIDRIGLFDEGYSPFLYEESDYCMRAKRARFRVIYCPYVTLVHRMGFTMARMDNRLKLYIAYRNMTRFRLVNYPRLWVIPSMIALLLGAFMEREEAALPFASVHVSLGREAAVRMVFIIRGLIDNLTHLDEIILLRMQDRART